jgi:hypothetical protein
MVQVTSISVTRSRKVQPEQYGSADAAITVVGNLAEGETWQDAARALLNDTRAIVYENLGLKLPARASETVIATEKPGAVEVTAAEKPATTVVEKSTATSEVPEAAGTKKRGPGRPVGSGKKQATVEPPTDTTEPNIRANPENRVNPADEIPDDPTPGTAPVAETPSAKQEAAKPVAAALSGDYSASDLQSFLSKMVRDKKITAARVRELIASQGAARTSDLKPDQVLKVKGLIEAEIGPTV